MSTYRITRLHPLAHSSADVAHWKLTLGHAQPKRALGLEVTPWVRDEPLDVEVDEEQIGALLLERDAARM